MNSSSAETPISGDKRISTGWDEELTKSEFPVDRTIDPALVIRFTINESSIVRKKRSSIAALIKGEGKIFESSNGDFAGRGEPIVQFNPTRELAVRLETDRTSPSLAAENSALPEATSEGEGATLLEGNEVKLGKGEIDSKPSCLKSVYR